jgi:hypothetical protein
MKGHLALYFSSMDASDEVGWRWRAASGLLCGVWRVGKWLA